MYESTKPDLSWQCFAYSLHFSSAIIYRNILCRHCYIWQTERWTTLLDGSETSSHLLPFSLPLSVNVDREGPKRKDDTALTGNRKLFQGGIRLPRHISPSTPPLLHLLSRHDRFCACCLSWTLQAKTLRGTKSWKLNSSSPSPCTYQVCELAYFNITFTSRRCAKFCVG